MKILFTLFFLIIFLDARTASTCYTVQLVSTDKSAKNMKQLNSKQYPQECKVMTIGNTLTVRCACIEEFKEAKEKLKLYQNNYSNAALASTYKYRFQDINESGDTLLISQKQRVNDKVQENEKLKSDTPKKLHINNRDTEKTCYTLQLASVPTSKINLDTLTRQEYPQGCKLMEIGQSLTIRCGCYDNQSTAKESLKEIQQKYADAVLARTYKYRFAEKSDGDKKVPVISQTKREVKSSSSLYKNVSDNEELQLILQVYLYKSDLENAYKVARLGYKRSPNSYYWNQQMAQISKWTNRSQESIKYLKKMYKIKYNKALEEELIQYGTSVHQYEDIEHLVVNRARRYPTEKNIDAMILVYKKIGSPEKVISELEKKYYANPENTMFLTKALALSLELGDLDLAKKYVNIIEKKQPYKQIDAKLIAEYYYVQQNIENAYASLLTVDQNETLNTEDKISYHMLESDLGWYLQDNYNAAIASKKLMDLNASRLADYERVAFVFQKSEPIVAMSAIKRAYEEHKLSYLFYSYANEAINHKSYDDLNQLIIKIEKEDTELTKESLFWIIKSKLYAHYNDSELEKSALLKALELEPDNYQIKLTLLWNFMALKDSMALKDLLTDMADDYDLDSSAYFPMASAYFYLSDMNRASQYIDMLIYENNPIIELIDFKFLQAYLYQIKNNQGAFTRTIKEIVKELKKQGEDYPELKKNGKYLSQYLRASIYIDNPKKFKKRLKKSKKYLDKKDYDEISYSWALKNSAVEKSLKIYNRMELPELWVEFSKSINFQEHSRIENILDLYLPVISMGDASQATEKDGQIALSQSFTFEGYQKNDDNQNAYIHHRDLSKIRSDYLDIKPSYFNRDPLLQKYIKVTNKSYIANGYYIDANFEYYRNKTLDKKFLVTVPEETIESGIGFTKVFDRGRVSAHIDYYNSMEQYYGASLSATYRPSTDIVVSAKLVKNDNSLESVQLQLGGKKDQLSMEIIWSILDSTRINLLYEKNLYSSQDEVDLGHGSYSRLSVIRQIRNGYPDMRIGAFFDYGVYHDTNGTKGVIDELQVENYKIIPEDFYNVGLTFSYGMANADDYTRAWRPYLEVYPYYNSQQDSYSVGINVGYGGKVWHQDHLIFGATYSEDVSGIGGKIFELFLDYHFMYAHP